MVILSLVFTNTNKAFRGKKIISGLKMCKIDQIVLHFIYKKKVAKFVSIFIRGDLPYLAKLYLCINAVRSQELRTLQALL